MYRAARRTTPRVKQGRVQRKNRWTSTPSYWDAPEASLVVDRRRAGRGYKHIVRKQDVRRFIRLLPMWDELSEGLHAILLDSGDQNCLGWHRSGVVALCAWDVEISWDACYPSFCNEHASIFDKLMIPYERVDEQWMRVDFTVETARAFQLIHVLVHEFGHHHDRMTTRSQRKACRGENYAESYARRYEDEIVGRYQRAFKI